MITRIRLRNWKSHLDSEFSFSPGVNALVGIVGSGKSSIMQAVSFGLFGAIPGTQARRVKLDDLIMAKPQRKKRAEVELEFRAGEDTYLVKRALEMGKGTSEAEFRKNGTLVDVNSRNVSREVEKALQMDFDLFSRAVYSEQNELDHFLRIPRGKRMGHIDRMLRVDRFENARGEAVSLMNRVSERREEKVRMLSDLEKEKLGERIKETREGIERMGKEREGLVKEKEQVSREKGELDRKLEEMEKVQEELEEARSSLKATRELVKEMGEQLRERKKIDVRDISKVILDLEGEARIHSGDMEKLAKEMGELNGEIKALAESAEELEKVEGKCPVCESDITPEKRGELVLARREREAGLRENVGKLAETIRELREEKENLEKKLIELKAEKQRQEETGEMEKRLQGHMEREKELSGALEKMEKGFSREKLKELREKVRVLVGRESEIVERVFGIENVLEEKKSGLEGLTERQELLEKYKGEAEQDGKAVEMLEKFIRALRQTQEQLRGEFVQTVNSIMERVWGELYPYGDFQGIRLAVDGDYILQLKGMEGWVPVEGVVSGGERSMACLALRIAFSYAFIPNLKWLILDEPTHNLDSNSIRQLGEVLRERMSSFAEQVFLITHEERISEGVETLYRLERDKGKGEPTRVVAG